MQQLVPLVAAVALLSVISAAIVEGQLLEKSKLDVDNALHPNEIKTQPRRKLRRFVRISQPPVETARLGLDSSLKLSCAAMGSPAPSIHWLKDGELIEEYESNEIYMPHPKSLARIVSTLIVTSRDNIKTKYTCVAKAGFKTDTASSIVYVEQDEDTDLILLQKLLTPQKPVITLYYSEIFQTSGGSVVLPCRVASDSNAEVEWQDSDHKIIYKDNLRMKVLQSGDLLISNLLWPDMGQFTCTAKNQYGEDSISTYIYPVKPS